MPFCRHEVQGARLAGWRPAPSIASHHDPIEQMFTDHRLLHAFCVGGPIHGRLLRCAGAGCYDGDFARSWLRSQIVWTSREQRRGSAGVIVLSCVNLSVSSLSSSSSCLTSPCECRHALARSWASYQDFVVNPGRNLHCVSIRFCAASGMCVNESASLQGIEVLVFVCLPFACSPDIVKFGARCPEVCS